jgi:hypothetical protein
MVLLHGTLDRLRLSCGLKMLPYPCCAEFDDLIAKHVELSFFVPLIMGHGGNTGSQATCAIIRALALKQISFRNILAVLFKEAAAGCLMGEAMLHDEPLIPAFEGACRGIRRGDGGILPSHSSRSSALFQVVCWVLPFSSCSPRSLTISATRLAWLSPSPCR